ncbi:MAG: hypothetical protein ACT4PL_05325 [Phycisphaerales bacterium]
MALGKRWDAFGFVPGACAWLQRQGARGGPIDAAGHALCMLLCANYVRAGLRTAAEEELGAVDPVRSAVDPAVASLRATLRGVGEVEVTVAGRVATARANLDALLARGVAGSIEPGFAAWAAATEREAWFRTRCGEIVRKVRGEGAWLSFEPSRRRALGMDLALLERERAGVFVEGVDPPWLLCRVSDLLGRDGLGYWPRIRVVETSPKHLLDGLACADVRAIASAARSAWFVGEDAMCEVERDFAGRMHENVGRAVLSARADAGGGPVGGEGLAEVVGRFHEAQSCEADRVVQTIDRQYAGHDAQWLARRCAEALSGGGERLRVLVPTTRFSTFLQHSSRDIAGAFAAMGAEARILIEPDDSTQTTGIWYAREIEAFRPDLLLLINYTRAHIGRFIPANLPVVTWAQDAMPHLLRAGTGAGLRTMDFVVGHLYPEFFPEGKVRHERAIWSPVLVSRSKFHAGPVGPDLRERMECEIAAVTHHSQTPEEYRDKLLSEVAPGSIEARMVYGLYDVMAGAVGEIVERDFFRAGRDAITAIARQAGREPTVELRALAFNQIFLPIADRFLRQQTLIWAAELAEERGWRLHIHGRGWSAHPRLAAFDRGVLAHGEELRAAYQCAGVNLHASVQTNIHQRVMECALSGGLPLCRLKHTDVARIGALVRSLVARDGTPRQRGGVEEVASVADHPAAMAFTALQQRLGLCGRTVINGEVWTPGEVNVDRALLADPWSIHDGVVMTSDVMNICGDLAETTFWSKETLAVRVASALDRPAWREDLSKGIAARVDRSMTYEAMAPRIVELIARASAAVQAPNA